MRIGLVFDDEGYNELDLRYPENGNPGVGGTQFCFLMLARYLKSKYSDIKIYIYHLKNNFLPNGTISKIINNEYDSIKMAIDDKIDILIFRNGKDEKWYDEIKKFNIKYVVWAHNYITDIEAKKICDIDNIKRVVFVGKQEYDRYIDDDIINKSEYIYNMFNSNIKEYKRNKEFNKNVTYTGSLIPVKGFHILAEEWKNILKEVPDAKLNVIGNGKLYDRSSKLGKYNIADEKYENQFMKYLTDEKGNVLPSVNFLGVLGQEKLDIYKDTMVGVINPSGITETFGLSAVEMEACEIPIVTKKIYGLPDTTKHKKTGLLSNTKKQFRKDIIKLLKNREYNIKLGNQAKEFVSNEFDPNKIVVKWVKLFNDILDNKAPQYYKPNNCFFNDYKYLRMINRYLRKIVKKFPSILRLKNSLKN